MRRRREDHRLIGALLPSSPAVSGNPQRKALTAILTGLPRDLAGQRPRLAARPASTAGIRPAARRRSCFGSRRARRMYFGWPSDAPPDSTPLRIVAIEVRPRATSVTKCSTFAVRSGPLGAPGSGLAWPPVKCPGPWQKVRPSRRRDRLSDREGGGGRGAREIDGARGPDDVAEQPRPGS